MDAARLQELLPVTSVIEKRRDQHNHKILAESRNQQPALCSDVILPPRSGSNARPRQMEATEQSWKRKANWPDVLKNQKTARLDTCSADQIICERCCYIDFAQIVSSHNSDRDTGIGYDICSLEYVNPGSGCSLCRFLFSMKQDQASESMLRHSLRAYSAGKRVLGTKAENDVVLFSVVESKEFSWTHIERFFYPSSSLDSGKPSSTTFRATSAIIEWRHIKDWITFCQEHHGELCKQNVHVSGLQVLDCETSQVVELPSSNTPYITLSYVVRYVIFLISTCVVWPVS
jgi:hypothetical protein